MTREDGKKLRSNQDYNAWIDGAQAQTMNSMSDWVDTEFPSFAEWIRGKIRLKPAPKLRPWKASEIPLECWFRNKLRPESMFKLTVIRGDCVLMGYNALNGSEHNFDSLLAKMEHSVDGGKTWAECGILDP